MVGGVKAGEARGRPERSAPSEMTHARKDRRGVCTRPDWKTRLFGLFKPKGKQSPCQTRQALFWCHALRNLIWGHFSLRESFLGLAPSGDAAQPRPAAPATRASEHVPW